MNDSIANVVVGALSGFSRLSRSIQESEDTSLRASLLSKIDDDLARFKVWAGSSGAHRTGRASLGHRLRDASHIRQQVLKLLSDLEDSLEDAARIMTGESTPWEETEGDEEPLDDLETETEMEQIALDITELVGCLMRLSVSIQNPAPHDRFMSSKSTDTSAYEDFDTQHVLEKFHGIDHRLAQRLGKAMSRRRQYFKYREDHHDKLSHGLSRHGDTNKTETTRPATCTTASSIPPHMKDEAPTDISGDDTQSDGRASATSFATSVSGPKTLKVPSMPEEAVKGPLMCPFCYLVISVKDTRAWKKHVFGDLRPYNCLASHCTTADEEFSRRSEWMQHMLQKHLRVYRCSFGCPEEFPSAEKSRSHLLKAHSGAIPDSKVDSIVELSSQPIAQDAHNNCPFCLETLKSLKQYLRHVGKHQQDLALFVLPKTETGDDDSEETHSLSGHESGDVSFSEQDEDEITTAVQTRQAVADAAEDPWDTHRIDAGVEKKRQASSPPDDTNSGLKCSQDLPLSTDSQTPWLPYSSSSLPAQPAQQQFNQPAEEPKQHVESIYAQSLTRRKRTFVESTHDDDQGINLEAPGTEAEKTVSDVRKSELSNDDDLKHKYQYFLRSEIPKMVRQELEAEIGKSFKDVGPELQNRLSAMIKNSVEKCEKIFQHIPTPTEAAALPNPDTRPNSRAASPAVEVFPISMEDFTDWPFDLPDFNFNFDSEIARFKPQECLPTYDSAYGTGSYGPDGSSETWNGEPSAH